MSISDGKIYILGERTVYLYDADTLRLLDTTKIDEMDNNFSYISGIFVK